MDFENSEKRKGIVLLAEALGTAFFVTAYSLELQSMAYLALPMVYFVFCLLLLPISGAHMNPAISTALYISMKKAPGQFGYLLMVIMAQFVGGLIGMQLAHLYRVTNN